MAYLDTTIDKILECDNIGAGNFLHKLAELGLADQQVLYLDTKYREQTEFDHLSVASLKRLVNIYASWYRTQGIETKDTVAIYLNDGIEYFVQYLALTTLGAIPIFLNGEMDSDIAVQFMKKVDTIALITDDQRLTRLDHKWEKYGFKPKFLDISQVDITKSTPQQVIPYNHQPDDPVLLAHTSGTTGIPKAVRFNHSSLFYGFSKQLKEQVGERLLSALPHSHASSLGILMSVFLKGVTALVQTNKDPETLLATVERFKPDMFISFPKIYVELCRFDLADFDFSSIQYWLSTGDANHESHIRQLVAQGHHIVNGEKYQGSLFIDNLGSTEFAYAVFVNVHTPYSNNYDRCVGKPISWAQVAVLSPEGKELGNNQIGKLGVKSGSLTPGYWNNSLLAEKSKLNEYWLLGDLVYRNDSGVYYHVDRVQDVINIGDEEIYSCKVEELALKNIDYIFDCSLVSVKNKQMETELYLTVDLKQDQEVEVIKNDINNLLFEYALPQVNGIVLESSNVNVGVTGKKLKRQVRDLLAE